MTRATLAALAVLALAGCDDMIHQKKQNAYASAKTGPGPVPAGTVAYRERPAPPPKLTLALIERGRQRFRVFCTPCHSEVGDGRGMIPARGFSPPPTYHQQRLREAPTTHLYDVISNGWGAMYPFNYRIPPDDRWAIAAYIRALQRSQDATGADLERKQASAGAEPGR